MFCPQNCSVLRFPIAFLLKDRKYEHVLVIVLPNEVLVKFSEKIFVVPVTM